MKIRITVRSLRNESKNEIAHQDIGKFTLHDKHHLENHLKNRRSEIRIH